MSGRRPSRPRPGSHGSRDLADLAGLVAAARDGDRVALEDLVRATYADSYALAHRLTGNEDDASDVVQEAYLRAHRGLRRFRGDAQFSTWMYRITANCASTLLARRSRNRTETLTDDTPVADPHPDHDPEGRAASEDDRARVAAALARLPARLRQVIVLRDIYDLPHSSIAAELAISEAAAKVRLHRARRKMREHLAEVGEDAHRSGDHREVALIAPEVRGAERAPVDGGSEEEDRGAQVG